MTTPEQTITMAIISGTEDSREMFKRFLRTDKSARYLFHDFASGEDALRTTLQCHYDVFIIEDNLPDMTGQVFLNQLASEAQQSAVLLATDAGREYRVAGREYGAYDVISKQDLTRAYLIHVVHHTLERARLQRMVQQHEATIAERTADLQSLRHALERRIAQQQHELEKVQAVLSDEIEERHRLSAALQLCEDQRHWLLEQVHEGIGIIDQDGIIRQSNQQMDALFERGSLLGHPINDVLVPMRQAHTTTDLLYQLLVAHAQHPVRLRRANGDPFWSILAAKPITTDEGSFTGLMLMVKPFDEGHPITRSFQFYEQILDSIGMGIAVCDAQHPNLPVIYHNAALERNTGYAAGEVQGRNLRFLQGTDSQQEGLLTLRAALKQGTSCQVRLRNYRKDGSRFLNDLFVTPLYDDGGTLTHFVGAQMNVPDVAHAHSSPNLS